MLILMIDTGPSESAQSEYGMVFPEHTLTYFQLTLPET